jgi:hypothetical protein
MFPFLWLSRRKLFIEKLDDFAWKVLSRVVIADRACFRNLFFPELSYRHNNNIVRYPNIGHYSIASVYEYRLDFTGFDLGFTVAKAKLVEGFLPIPLVLISTFLAFCNRHCFSFFSFQAATITAFHACPDKTGLEQDCKLFFDARGISSAEGKKLLSVMIGGLRVGIDKAGRG